MSTSIDESVWDDLIAAATEAADRAHAPYSNFQVGAALLTDDDEIVSGSNVENATLGATVCAERTAIGNAVTRGKRKFKALAVMTPADKPVAPCGICRQVLAEFCDDIPVMLATRGGQRLLVTLDELLPYRFSGADF